jgi:hypothetical protein
MIAVRTIADMLQELGITSIIGEVHCSFVCSRMATQSYIDTCLRGRREKSPGIKINNISRHQE